MKNNENNSDRTAKKVGYLNEAAMDIRKGIDKIKLVYKGDRDLDLFIWNIEKAVTEIQKFIFTKLQNECIQEEFDETIKGFDRIFQRKEDRRRRKKDGN